MSHDAGVYSIPPLITPKTKPPIPPKAPPRPPARSSESVAPLSALDSWETAYRLLSVAGRALINVEGPGVVGPGAWGACGACGAEAFCGCVVGIIGAEMPIPALLDGAATKSALETLVEDRLHVELRPAVP